jgi:hypothetical protein
MTFWKVQRARLERREFCRAAERRRQQHGERRGDQVNGDCHADHDDDPAPEVEAGSLPDGEARAAGRYRGEVRHGALRPSYFAWPVRISAAFL